MPVLESSGLLLLSGAWPVAGGKTKEKIIKKINRYISFESMNQSLQYMHKSLRFTSITHLPLVIQKYKIKQLSSP